MGWGSRKTNVEGGLPKKGAPWTFCKFKGGDLARKRVVIFLRGGLIPQCTHCLYTQPTLVCELAVNARFSVFMVVWCIRNETLFVGTVTREHVKTGERRKNYRISNLSKHFELNLELELLSQVKDCFYNKIGKRECAARQEKLLMNF